MIKQRAPAQTNPKGIGVKNMETTIEYQNFINDVRSDLKSYILERWDSKEIKDIDRDEVYDEAFTADSVTGNGSGSYFLIRGRQKNLSSTWMKIC